MGTMRVSAWSGGSVWCTIKHTHATTLPALSMVHVHLSLSCQMLTAGTITTTNTNTTMAYWCKAPGLLLSLGPLTQAQSCTNTHT